MHVRRHTRFPWAVPAGILSLTLSWSAAAAPYKIPNDNPSTFSEIQGVVDNEIPNDLNQAMCGGWNFDVSVNGVFNHRETVCPPAAEKDINGFCRDKADLVWKKTDTNTWVAGTATRTDADMDANKKETDETKGMIPEIKNLPGRDIEGSLWNIQSGVAKRKDTDGLADYFSGIKTGFTYPTDADTVGFTTICRPPDHPDTRTLPTLGQNFGPRDKPDFLCPMPCQRPLDGPPPKGKPQGWAVDDSTKISCGAQQPYPPEEDEVKYSCGGLQMKGPDDNFALELTTNGPRGGLCQDLNSWVYILWKKVVHVCYTQQPDIVMMGDPPVPTPVTRCNPAPIYRYEKGPCGFPKEMGKLGRNTSLCTDGYVPEVANECCSDDPYGMPNVQAFSGSVSVPTGGTNITSCTIDMEYDMNRIGTSCVTCTGDKCRIYPDKNNVIINDVWFDPFPADLPGGCGIDPADASQCTPGFVAPDSYPVNHGVWTPGPEPEYRKKTEDRGYISYFRDYNQASYERMDLKVNVPKDVNKMEKIPVACYGMYDWIKHQETLDPDPKIDGQVPEDAKTHKIRTEDKRCVIGAYYPTVNFTKDALERKETQKGKGIFRMTVNDDPFADPARPFDADNDMWYNQLTHAFSMLNEKAYKTLFDDTKNLTFALLAPDTAVERAQPQIDKQHLLSSGALVRAFDHTVTYDKQPERTTRTVDEWWQWVETEMHKALTPPTVRMLIPTTWSTGLDALDPLFVTPLPPLVPETDPRSETVEVQVRAREDLMGDVTSFLERAMLLRVEEAPVPIVVPTGTSPTELRAIAQGWESWAAQQQKYGRPGVTRAREVRDKLLGYADRIDEARVLRSELPKYAGALLEEQQKIGKSIADWDKQNIDAYQSQLDAFTQIENLQVTWQALQGVYGKLHDNDGLPWCRNSRFTAPIYSLLDPWLPGREKQGDTTAGMKPFVDCMTTVKDFDVCTDTDTVINCATKFVPGVGMCIAGGTATADCFMNAVASCTAPGIEKFSTYFGCMAYVSLKRLEEPGSFHGRVCDQYLPQPPLLPFPTFKKDPDLTLDFTPFKDAVPPIAIPVLKPREIRIKLNQIDPPGLETTEEPQSYPDLPDFPPLPLSIADAVKDNLPKVRKLRDAHALDALGGGNPLPSIPAPTMDTDAIDNFLQEAQPILIGMSDEYSKFWNSLIIKMCDGGGGSDCVKPGTEQDCIRMGDDPKGKCVHYEADLKERMQDIGARPGVFLKEDMDSRGYFRDPIVHGQRYCEKQDWACQLLNAYQRHQRTGWMVTNDDEEAVRTMIDALRKDIREETQNAASSSSAFPYDMPQEEMLQNFKIVAPNRVETHTDSIKP